MPTLRSPDGTMIAYDRLGSGPPVVLVDGALCSRTLGPMMPIARQLAASYTVIAYDRRGRGESGDTPPYAPAREVEDVLALVEALGGTASLFGISSGAALALEAAKRHAGVRRLAVFEAPFVVDDTRPPIREEWERIEQALADGRPDDALRTFLGSVGVPRPLLWLMRRLPLWKRLRTLAPTLPYDGALVQRFQLGAPLSAEEWAGVAVPALVLDGGRSPAWMRHAMRALADVLPSARYHTLPGQTHNISAAAIAPVLAEFFASDAVPRPADA